MKEKLLNLIHNSVLSRDEQSELASRLNLLSEKDAEAIASLFENQPEWILRFYRNYKLKKQALDNNDKDLFRKIVEEEVKILESEDL